MRDVICTSCSDVALSVAEDVTPSDIVTMRFRCYGCECHGAVDQVDEDGQAKLVFRADEEPVPFTVAFDGPTLREQNVIGNVLAHIEAEFGRQRAEGFGWTKDRILNGPQVRIWSPKV